MKSEVVKILSIILVENRINFPNEEIEKLIEIPPSSEMGDFAFPCFVLAKEMKKSPNLIAEDFAKKITKNLTDKIEKVKAIGPYINFFLNKQQDSEKVLKEILKLKNSYGKNSDNKIGRVMIEFPSPNTNKPLHLGHLRNMAIGESVSRILEFGGNKVIRANQTNDRGIHICKSMLAYQKSGNGKKPDKKPDHFVGDFYVMFSKMAKENPGLEKEAQEMLVKWEKGDKDVLALWKKMNKWAFDGMDETYKRFGIKHDANYYESKIYTKGKEIIFDGLNKGIFKKRDDGAIIIDLTNDGLDEKVVLRADGTSIYITQDLALAKLKAEKNIDGSIYVTGNEQDYHFKVLFLILKKLGFKFADNLKHLSYGMVGLPEGKMKSREGNVVDADELMDEVQNLAREELEKRQKLPKRELEKRASKIALSAIKYHFLKTDIFKNMVFDPKESISFDGNTGPYLLYSYARANSILKKAKVKEIKKFSVGKFEKQEWELTKKLSEFPVVVKDAGEKYNPSLIAHYSYELAQLFNEFYHACSVMEAEKNKRDCRLALVESFKIVLKNSLNLLRIETLEEM